MGAAVGIALHPPAPVARLTSVRLLVLAVPDVDVARACRYLQHSGCPGYMGRLARGGPVHRITVRASSSGRAEARVRTGRMPANRDPRAAAAGRRGRTPWRR